jgi:isopentenyl-diphosphate delta-isomerase
MESGSAMKKFHVILVNEKDEETGSMEKMQVHHEGVLHRAFSVFILNSNHQMLLQQRADGKYHSPGLWSNACCSHPRPGEETMQSAHKRLMEEMGFDCDFEPLFILRYKSEVGNGLTENEIDHIYIGYYDGPVTINPEEVKTWRYMDLNALQEWMKEEPEAFTNWFHLAMPEFLTRYGG